MAAGVIRTSRSEGEESGSPRAPTPKRAARGSRVGGGTGTGGGGGTPRHGGGGGGASPRAVAVPLPPPPPPLEQAEGDAEPSPASFLKTFPAEDGLVLYAPSPSDALAEAASNKESQVYFGE
jgi:hypothetical protein